MVSGFVSEFVLMSRLRSRSGVGAMVGIFHLSVLLTGGVIADDRPSTADREFFETRIRPLLVEKCYRCHSVPKADKGGLVVDSRTGLLEGGDRGPAIVPGSAAKSLLIQAVSYEDPELQMPPKNRLSEREIADLRVWIERGAPDPRIAKTPQMSKDFDLETRRAEHWAWQPIEPSPPPATRNASWPESTIDRFVLARLETVDLQPAEAASRSALIRRVTFDLTGLPPTVDEVSRFAADDSPGATEKLVDQLLASPRFGEHWGQHWLDLMRFAETQGHEQDYTIPQAFRYRDYVIRALNGDVPYDRFVTEHVAGDLVGEPRLDPIARTNDSILGTGFWHLGEAAHSPVDIRGEEAERIANQIDVFSRAFLGLTVACARCHSHKFDAISTEDYYGLTGYLQSSSYHIADISDPGAHRQAERELRLLKDEFATQLRKSDGIALAVEARRVSEYLLGARTILPAAKLLPLPTKKKKRLPVGRLALRFDNTIDPPREFTPETVEAVSDEAAGRRLDAKRLSGWLSALQQAAEDVRDPLYPFARVARSAVEGGEEFEKVKRQVVAAWANLERESVAAVAAQTTVRTIEDGERNYVSTEQPFRPEDLFWNATNPGLEWITFGRRFGDGPGRKGELVLGPSSDVPVVRILEEDAAVSDLVTSRLTGMLRTPTFEVTSDHIWYRYTGEAKVFLAVDSYRAPRGPLHRVADQELKGDHKARWFAHEVKDYIGHKVHVEFTPVKNFMLSRIQFCGAPPVDVFRRNGRVADALQQSGSVAELAGAYQQIFSNVARESLGNSSSAELATDADVLSVANWLFMNRALLEPRGDEAKLARARFEEFATRRSAIEKRIPADVRGLTLINGSAVDDHVHIRGNHKTLAPEPTQRRLLTALGGAEYLPPERGSGRLELAAQLTSRSNPLVARVLANRVWHHLFGRGIVPTVDDFGVMGQLPSHPDLLDYLAHTLMDDGWSVKRLVRCIVLSSTYRMASRPRPELAERVATVDPTNRLLHSMPIRRLRGEAIRDALLAVSGHSDRKMEGPGVMVHITPFMRGNRSPKGSGPVDSDGRRSIYIEVRRNHISHFLSAFDKPIPFTAIGRRSVSNSPAQPLILLNDEFVHQQAASLADTLLKREGATRNELIGVVYLTLFARSPEEWERAAALDFLDAQEANYEGDDRRARAWKDLCHTLVNVKEFIFLN